VISDGDHHVWDGSSQQVLFISSRSARTNDSGSWQGMRFTLRSFFLPSAAETFNVAVGRYVIMPDHVHLFVRGDYNFRLGPWIGALKQALAKAATLSRAKGQIWEEGFFDHILRSNESYSQKWNYVRKNPVRAGLVKSAADWSYQGEIVYIDRPDLL
jgi:REP element-mobilizing transposase RayT